jgi:hypothetical protein
VQVVFVAASYVVEQTGADTAAGAKTNTVTSVTIANMATRRHRSTFISQPSAVSVGSAQVKASPDISQVIFKSLDDNARIPPLLE